MTGGTPGAGGYGMREGLSASMIRAREEDEDLEDDDDDEDFDEDEDFEDDDDLDDDEEEGDEE